MGIVNSVNMANAAKLAIQRLTPQHSTAAVDLIANSFTSLQVQDPFNNIMGLKKRHWRRMAGLFVERAAQDNLSLVAVDENNGEVMGVMLNEDWKEVPPKEFRSLGEDWKPTQAIFAAANNQFKASQGHIARGQMLHTLYFSCVHPDMRRQGLMQNMWQESVAVAQRYNFSEMMAHCSSDKVARLAEKLGFEKAASVKYKDFKYEGHEEFAELPEMSTDYRELGCWKRKVPSDLY